MGLEARTLTTDEAHLAPSGGAEPVLVLRRSERPGPAPRRATGLFHTAFLYPGRAALGTALRRLTDELGLRLTGVADHGVSEALYLDDPDGLGVELYRDRPRSEWPEPAPGERVRMYTEPLDTGALASAGENDAPTAGAGESVEVGHVHLKVGEVESAVAFWTRQGSMDLTTRFGRDAAFLSYGGYHHHIAVNTWISRGAAPEPADGPGLDAVVIRAGDEREPGESVTPDGIRVRFEAQGDAS